MFTNGILLHRSSGPHLDLLSTGTDSFKRVLGSEPRHLQTRRIGHSAGSPSHVTYMAYDSVAQDLNLDVHPEVARALEPY
jgi:hypothetical protein